MKEVESRALALINVLEGFIESSGGSIDSVESPANLDDGAKDDGTKSERDRRGTYFALGDGANFFHFWKPMSHSFLRINRVIPGLFTW